MRRDCGCHFSADQFVCTYCRRLKSVWSSCDHVTEHDRCDQCDGRLERWTGRVYFRQVDPLRAWPREEVIEGPCPVCGEPLTPATTGLWD